MISGHSPEIFREAAYSFVHAELKKIDKIVRRRLPNYLRIALGDMQTALSSAVDNVSDSFDLQDLRNKIDIVSQFLNIVLNSVRDYGSWWALPLIRECYAACKIPGDRNILIVHTPLEESQAYTVIPNILGSVKLAWNKETKGMDWHRLPPIDVFSIPTEAGHDLSSIALIAHEVGHVFWSVNENRRQANMRELMELKTKDMFNQPDPDHVNSQLHEYLCDEVGRFLLGPIFDFALIKQLAAISNRQDEQLTHPPKQHRINLCYENLSFHLKEARLQDATFSLRDALSRLRTLVKPFYRENYQLPQQRETHASWSICETMRQSSFMLFSKELRFSIKNVWDTARAELDSFRPPLESVSREKPVPISPREALAGTTLYYYSQAYSSQRSYFHQAASEEGGKDQIRSKLVAHLRYAVSLSEFVSAVAQEDTSFEKNDWDRALWNKRCAKKKENNLVIVPSIKPALQYGASTIDLRLGTSILVSKLTWFPYISSEILRLGGDGLLETQAPRDLASCYKELHIPIGSEFILHPRQFVLASTLEYLCMPEDFYGLVLGRSSWGRLGLNIATATTVHAGFHGCLTLELRNRGETPIALRPGTRIAQLALIPVPPHESEHRVPDSLDRKYEGSVKAEVSKLEVDPDWALLDRFSNQVGHQRNPGTSELFP